MTPRHDCRSGLSVEGDVMENGFSKRSADRRVRCLPTGVAKTRRPAGRRAYPAPRYHLIEKTGLSERECLFF
jgi:hypothetical protein